MLSACGKSDERASLEKDVKTKNDDLKNQKKDLEKQKKLNDQREKLQKKLMIQLRQNHKDDSESDESDIVTQINHQIVIHTNNLRAKVPLKIARQVTKRILLRQMVVVIHAI